MNGMDRKDPEQSGEFANVEVGREYIVPEEFPEGPYGAPRGKFERIKPGKKGKKGQRVYSAFNYEYKQLHENLPRQMDGAHPPHDEKGE
jgi:hypothetical protein